MKTQILSVLKSQKWICILVGLIAVVFGTRFSVRANTVLTGQLAIDIPEPQALIDTANDVAATMGWSESATIDTYQGQEYVTLKHNESSGSCTFYYFVVIGKWELSSRARSGSSMDFHGYEASHNQSTDGTLDSIWWQARVECYAEVSSYDCPPADAMPLAEALYAAAARNGLLEVAFSSTQTASPAIEPITLTISVENNYTAIASDGESELILQAFITGPVSAEDVNWSATNLDSSEDITSQLTLYTDDEYHSLAIYKPSEIYSRPFNVEVRATLLTTQGEISDSTQIRVVRPPVILVHGIWSDSSAMLPLEKAISFSDSMFGTRVSRIDYSVPSSYGDMTQKVDMLGSEVAEILASLNNMGTKVNRADIVAHSMGGLIARLYIINNASSVRKLITLATPHSGTPFANWYHELVVNGLQSCPPGNAGTYTTQLPTKGELEWFLMQVRNSVGLRSDALQYGEAVKQLQTNEMDSSISHLLRGYSQPGSVQYYFLAGNDPFISSTNADRLAILVRQLYPFEVNSYKPGDCGQIELSQGLNSMIEDFFDKVSEAGTDGVVPLDSARGKGLNAREVATIHATHFSIVGNSEATDAVIRYLTDQKANLSGTQINTNSPGHLHVYDNRDNHVGLDEDGNIEMEIDGAYYLPYANATGDHEIIWVPPEVEGVQFEFVADEEGLVGLEIGQGLGDGLHFFSYEDVEVVPGSTITIQVHPTHPEGRITHPDGQTISLSPTFSEIGYGIEGSGYSSGGTDSPAGSKLKISEIMLVCACVQGWLLAVGGLVGVILLRQRQPENKTPVLILGIAVIVLTISTCLLGAYMVFGRSSNGSNSEGSNSMNPLPTMERLSNTPEPLSQGTSEIPQTAIAELTVVNDSSTVICYVLISPVESDDWGDDWLGSDEMLLSGNSRKFQLPEGTYHLAVLDCGDQILAEEYDVIITGLMEWTIQN